MRRQDWFHRVFNSLKMLKIISILLFILYNWTHEINNNILSFLIRAESLHNHFITRIPHQTPVQLHLRRMDFVGRRREHRLQPSSALGRLPLPSRPIIYRRWRSIRRVFCARTPPPQTCATGSTTDFDRKQNIAQKSAYFRRVDVQAPSPPPSIQLVPSVNDVVIYRLVWTPVCGAVPDRPKRITKCQTRCSMLLTVVRNCLTCRRKSIYKQRSVIVPLYNFLIE